MHSGSFPCLATSKTSVHIFIYWMNARKKERIISPNIVIYYICGAIVKAKEISTMATMSCKFSWTIVFLRSFLFPFLSFAYIYLRTHTRSRVLYISLFFLRFCIYDVLKSRYFILVCCFCSPWVPFPLFECCFYNFIIYFANAFSIFAKLLSSESVYFLIFFSIIKTLTAEIVLNVSVFTTATFYYTYSLW